MSAIEVTSNDKPVHVAVTLRVRPGNEAKFAELLTRFAQRSLEHRGATGVHLIYPVPGAEAREFGILRSFQSEDHSRAFYESEMYRQYKADTAHLVEGEPMVRSITGLEGFFRSGGHHLPPRWKMAIVTYLGVVPSVLFWSTMLKPLLREFPWLAAVAISNAAVVATLAWVMMPLLTKLFRPWLHAAPKSGELKV
jgi:antibiotic biosynthesis monooxygenase (ABM) superfamily enzyme